MKKMTAEDLRNLKYGDKVYSFINGKFEGYDFVDIMPASKNYLIFSDGENLTHLHISPKDNTFHGDWYSGEYDSDFVGYLLIDYYQKKIDYIRKHFLKKTNADIKKYNL